MMTTFFAVIFFRAYIFLRVPKAARLKQGSFKIRLAYANHIKTFSNAEDIAGHE